MWGRVSRSSDQNSSHISNNNRGVNTSAEERENIPPLASFSSDSRTKLKREAVVPYGKKNQEDLADSKSDEEVRSRSNLSYLAKLNRNNPTSWDSVPWIKEESWETDSTLSSGSSEVDKDKDKEGFEESPVSGYVNPDIAGSEAEEDMRRSRRLAGAGVQKSPRKSGSPRKAMGSIGKARKGVKRQQSPGADDSVMIISDADVDCTPTGFPRPEIMQEEGQVQRPKRIRLFQSPPPIGNFTSRRVDVNETIDLVDDDDYESISSDDEVVLLDEDNSVNNENDDVEIVGVRIVPKMLRSRSNSRSFTSPWIKSATRNSVKNNISFQNVQQSVRRAKKRMSNLNISRTATSRIVKRKKKKKKNQPMPRINAGGGTFQQQPQQQVYQNRYKKPRSRRTTVPVYLLDNELGPRNPEWNKSSRVDSRPPPQAAEFIPISTINTINSGPGPVSFPTASSTVTSQCLHTGPDGSSDLTKIAAAPFTQPEAFNLMFAPGSTRNRVPGTPRPIIIDASNVAMGHGMNNQFSCRGIKICVEYFKRRGHSEIIAFVPRFRCKSSESLDTHILNELEEQGVLKYTPSREAGGLRITSYDDRFIVQYAAEVQGIIVTNDNYRDIFDQQEDWRDQIRSRLLQFLWISEDCIMFPWDPLGRHGPSLETFLRF